MAIFYCFSVGESCPPFLPQLVAMNELSCSAKLKTTHGRQAPPFVEGDECPYLKTLENAAILLPLFLLAEKLSHLWMALYEWISFHFLFLGFLVILSTLEQKLI